VAEAAAVESDAVAEEPEQSSTQTGISIEAEGEQP
jgi:hypothetical protein